MHLFALLIAAVFSSNFVAPNTFASFTTTLKSITVDELEETVPTFTVTLNTAPNELPTGFITLVATDYNTAKVDFAALTLVSGTTYTVPATNIETLSAVAATQASIFIHLKDTLMSEAVYVEVPVAEAWTIAAAADFLDIQLPATPVFTITATHVLGWADNDAEFRFKRGDDAPVVATLPLDGDGTDDYTIATGDLSGLGILTADFADGPITLEVAIKFGANNYYAKTASLELKRSLPTFTTREILTKAEVNASTTFTFTPKTADAWDDNTVTVVLTKTKVEPADITSGKVAELTQTNDDWSCTIKLDDWNLIAAVTEFYAWIHLDDGQESNADAFLPTPATIVYDHEDLVVGTVVLNPATTTWVNLGATAAITVTATGQGATDLEAGATYKIVYTDASEEDHVKTDVLTVTGGTTYTIPSLDLSAWEIPNAATTLKVWIYPRGTKKSYPDAADYTVTKSNPEFSVTPDPVTTTTTIARLEITATDGTDWADAGIAAQLEYPGKTAIPVELALDTSDSNAAKVFFKENVDISTFEVANNTKITVKAAYAKPASGPAAFLPVPVEITVTLPTPPAEETFTITPATMVWSETLETPEVIVVAPSKTVSWTDPKAIFTYTPSGDALSNDPKTAEVDLVFDDPDWTIPEGSDLSDLEIAEPAEDEEVEVVVTIHTGEKTLAKGETFTITKSAPTPPPAFEFTLTLTTITDEAMKANLGEMTVSPKTGVKFNATAAAKGVFSATAPIATAQAHADGVQVDLAVVAAADPAPAKYKMAADTYKLEDLIPATLPGKIYFYLKEDGDAAWSIFGAPIDVTKAGSAAMGVSPLLSLLTALVFLFVKLF